MISTVLIADDNMDLCEFLADLFRERGCIVHAVADGASAVRIVQKQTVDFALVEMLLPGESGFRVLEELQRRGHGRAVIMSRMGAEEHRAYAEVLGAAGYLVKPFSVEAVLSLAPPPRSEVLMPITTQVDTVSAFK